MFETGIMYIAVGKNYLEEAVISARSSARFNQIPHWIFTDQPLRDIGDNVETRPFVSSGDGYRDKIEGLKDLPFERTIFLDTDTYVGAPIEELFELLDRFEVAAAFAPGYATNGDAGPSAAFYDCNTGVIALKRTKTVRDLIERWSQIYPLVTNGNAVDQHAFRLALWESSASFYVLPPEYNYRPRSVGRLVSAAKIVHGRSQDYEGLLAQLNETARPRVFERLL